MRCSNAQHAFARRGASDRAPVGFHALAAEHFDSDATRWAHASQRVRNARRRRWIARRCAQLREHAAYHRALIGARVPAAVARVAAQARHALECMRDARTAHDRRGWSGRYAALMHDALEIFARLGMVSSPQTKTPAGIVASVSMESTALKSSWRLNNEKPIT